MLSFYLNVKYTAQMGVQELFKLLYNNLFVLTKKVPTETFVLGSVSLKSNVN